jgi:hypothetical protein
MKPKFAFVALAPLLALPAYHRAAQSLRTDGTLPALLLAGPAAMGDPQHLVSATDEPVIEVAGAARDKAVPLATFKKTMTTIFWVGEDATEDNGYIHNFASFWDGDWMKHYGGVDSPDDRKGYLPAAFTPKQNPFYVALPFAELDNEGKLKEIAKKIPGFGSGKPLTKDRWVEVRYRGTSCFAQWQDVGPTNEDDFDWVFGSATRPKNTFGLKAGLDVSPAVADCLGMKDNDETEWRFVDEEHVPDGPWQAIVTR